MLWLIFLFGAIVHGCANALSYESTCLMASWDPTKWKPTCSFAAWVGAFSWIYAFVVLLYILLGLFEPWKELVEAKLTAQVEFIFGSLWAFIWFVLFCDACDVWRKNPGCKVNMKAPQGQQYCPDTYNVIWEDNHVKSNSGSVIAFAFFSTLAWGALAFLAFKRYKFGDSSYADESTGYGAGDYTAPKADGGAAGGAADPYQQPVADSVEGQVAEI